MRACVYCRLQTQKFDSSMIFEEIPIFLSMDEMAQALLHQCGIISLLKEKATPTPDPVTALVFVEGGSDV